eukprot:UN28464
MNDLSWGTKEKRHLRQQIFIKGKEVLNENAPRSYRVTQLTPD